MSRAARDFYWLDSSTFAQGHSSSLAIYSEKKTGQLRLSRLFVRAQLMRGLRRPVTLAGISFFSTVGRNSSWWASGRRATAHTTASSVPATVASVAARLGLRRKIPRQRFQIRIRCFLLESGRNSLQSFANRYAPVS